MDNQGGASLIEVMIAMAILVSGSLAFVQLDNKLLRHTRETMNHAHAAQLLQQKLVELQHTTSLHDGSDQIETDTHVFERRWQMSSEQGIVYIHVYIRWPDVQGEFSDRSQQQASLRIRAPELDLAPARPIQIIRFPAE
ncbi:MAG: prepilin-type N-terminal cleavage/methylation domain-containing protein [Gammaproteobacteria bacterium]|nr:prepilin-type N-terminal cleavage/methylation domain-containing protein [Gammaproteobacteria bacterium]